MLTASERKQSFRGALLLSFLFLFFLAESSYAYNGSHPSANLKKKQKKENALALNNLRQRMLALRQKLEEKQNEKNSAAQALRKIEVRIGEQAYVLKKINQQLLKQKKSLKKLKKQQGSARHNLGQQRDMLGEQIRSSYMVGKQAYLKLLLNQENPTAVDRALIYYDYFHKARAHNIDESITKITKLNNLTKRVNEKNKKLKVLLHQQQAAKQRLDDDFIDRAIIVKTIEKDIANKSKNLQQLSANERQLLQLLNGISEIMPPRLTQLTQNKKKQTFSKRRGLLKWPVKGKVKRVFGRSRQAANLKWNGVLIASKEGREVRSVSHGRVAYADWLRGYGMLLIVDHGDGYMTLYGYNQALYKETGDWVEEGEVIAEVGRSGGQKKSALYFEIRVKGKPSNPVKWCRS